MEKPTQSLPGNIYNFLKSKNIKNLPSSEEEFTQKISSDEQVRKNVYDFLSQQNVKNFPQSPEEFDTALGLKKKVDTGQDSSIGLQDLETGGSSQSSQNIENVPAETVDASTEPKEEEFSFFDDIQQKFENIINSNTSLPERLDLVTTNFVDKIYEGMESMGLDMSSLRAGNIARQVDNLAKLDESATMMKPTQDIVGAIEEGDFEKGAAAIVGTLMDIIDSGAKTIASAGTYPFTEAVASNYYNTLQETAKEQGKSPISILMSDEDKEALPAAAGILQGALEKLGLEKIGANYLKEMPMGIWKKVLEVAKTGGVEGVTETLQTAIEQVSEQVANGKEIKVAWRDLLNAGLSGFGGGSLAATPGAIFRGSEQNVNTEEANKQLLNESEQATTGNTSENVQNDSATGEQAEAVNETDRGGSSGDTNVEGKAKVQRGGAAAKLRKDEQKTEDTQAPEKSAGEEGISTEDVQAESTDQGTDAETRSEVNEQKATDRKNQTVEEENVTTTEPSEPKGTQEQGGEERKRRQFIENQLMEDPDISDDIKEGLSEDAKTYVPKSNEISNKEANAIIDAKGVDEAKNDFSNESNGMAGRVRVMLGENLIQRYNKQAKEATNESDKTKALDNAIDVADKLAKIGTEGGQLIQAFAAYSKLTPEGVVRANQQRFRTKRQKAMEGKREEIKGVQQELKRQAREAVSEASGSKKVKSILSKIKQKNEKSKLNPKVTKPENVSAAKKKFDDDFLKKLDSWKIDTKGRANDIVSVIGSELFNTAIDTVKVSYKAGKALQAAVEDAIAYIKKNFDGKWNEDEFRQMFKSDINKRTALDRLESGDVKGAINAELADLDTSFDKIVREHYTKQEKTKRSLLDKFTEDLGLEGADARELANAVESEYNRIATEKKKSALNKLYNKNVLPGKKRKKKQLFDKIIEAHNLGGLDTETLQDQYAEYMGLPSLKPEQAQKLMELSEKVQTAPEGFKRNKAIQDLYGYQDKIATSSKVKDIGDRLMGLYYSSMLSGISTQVLNTAANFAEGISELYVSALRNPKDAFFIARGMLNGFGKGLVEAKDIMKTGYTPARLNKVEKLNILETKPLPGGKWNPYNSLKYVSRVMAAGDAIFFEAAKEMRAYELAMVQARKAGKDKPTSQMRNDAIQILYNSKESHAEAKAQAESEGFKGTELKRRVFEIIEQKRGEEIQEDTIDFAARATFNYDPEGSLSVITNAIGSINSKLPLFRFIIPFARIISNVFNRYGDYFAPVGYARVLKGGIGWGGNKRSYTKEERARVMIKATTGTLAATAVMALIHGSEEDENGEKWFDITGPGLNDYKKNFELKESGWRPYSIKMGDTYLNFQNTPIAIPFSLIGQYRDLEKYSGESGFEAHLGLALMGTAQYMVDLTFLSGLSDFLDIFGKDNFGGSSAASKASRMLERWGKTFVVPNGYTQVSRAYQEIFNMPIKKAENFYQSLVRDMPVLRDDLNNIYNALGEPVDPDQIERFIPLNPSRVTDTSPEWELIISNKAWVGQPRRVPIPDVRKGADRDMTDKEYADYIKLAGELTKRGISRKLSSLKRMKPAEVRDEINEIKRDARLDARRELFGF